MRERSTTMIKSPDPSDLRHMRRAIVLARRGFPAPNPHVGCVIVRGHEVLAEGYHHFAGGPHAEIDALQKCNFQAQGATVYVTLEPCNRTGRTGPCSEALIDAGVQRVVYALNDPNPVMAGGAARLAEAGVDVLGGVLSDEAYAANEAFHWAFANGRPLVVGKAGTTLDGRIALANGESRWITGERARKAGRRLRAACGAVLVGPGTVVTDDPLLTVRLRGVKNPPVRIVLDPRGNLPSTARVFNADAPTWHVVPAASPCHGERVDWTDNLNDLLKEFRRRGLISLLVEGGGRTLGSFLQAGLVDRLELFTAPMVLGSGRAWAEFAVSELAAAPRFDFERVRRLGPDLQITLRPNR